jgi:hypothetical protein
MRDAHGRWCRRSIGLWASRRRGTYDGHWRSIRTAWLRRSIWRDFTSGGKTRKKAILAANIRLRRGVASDRAVVRETFAFHSAG